MENYVNSNPSDFTVNIGQLVNVFINLELSGSPVLDIIVSWWVIPIIILVVIWIRSAPKKSKGRRKSKKRRKSIFH